MNHFCSKCGASLPPESKSCPKCGAVLENEESHWSSKLTSALLLKVGIFISGIVLILSTILPYVSISILGFTQSQALIDGSDGYIFIALVVVVMVAAVLNKLHISLIFGVFSAVLCVWELMHTSSKLSELGDYAGFVNKGSGYYLNIIFTIVLAVLCVLAFLADKKKE